MWRDIKGWAIGFAALIVIALIVAPVEYVMSGLLGEHWLPIVVVVGAVIAAAYATSPKT